MDWGLLRTKEAGRYGLRPETKYPSNFYYYAIVNNLALRFFWVLNLGLFTIDGNLMVDLDVMVFLSTIAEAFRRTVWSLIRVENEFFNNFEAYRSIPTIPNLMDEVEVRRDDQLIIS